MQRNTDLALRARTQVHEEFEQVLRFLHRHVFPNASSRSRSKILGQNATERGIIIEETRNTLPIVLQAALAPLFTKFCKFENSFFAVLHTGGYYLSPKDSSNINSTRTMFWPQFLALCEHVRIIPALHVRDVAHAFLSASKRKYHVTKKTQISEMSQVFVTHELTYNSFLLALYVVFEREARVFQSYLSLQHALCCQKYSNTNSNYHS